MLGPLDTPTLGWPVRLQGRTLLAAEAGSRAAVEQSVERIIATEQGALEDLQGYGLPAYELLSDGGLPAPEEIAGLIGEQEPLANVQILRMPDQDAGWAAMRVSVAVAGDV